MIVLGKNYHVFGDHIVVKPIAKIEEGKILMIDRERGNEIFPNDGKVYTPSYHQKITIGNFMVYELGPSNTYEKNNISSHYYAVKQIKSNIPLFEVYHIDESFEKDALIIGQKIRMGFSSKIETLEEIILKTSDNYLLGPFKTEYDSNNRKVKIINNFEIDKYILPVYDNSNDQISLATYYDKFDEVQRSFTLSYPDEENIIGNLDIATNDYIVREAIRALRGQEEFGDITRKAFQRISEWLKNITFSEEYNTQRLKKTVELLEEIIPEDGSGSEYQKYAQKLLSLPSVQSMIDEQKEKKFELEIESFLKENEDIVSKNKELKVKHSNLVEKITTNQKRLDQIQQNIEKYSHFMSTKKENMEKEILESYFQQLLASNLSGNQMSNHSFLLNEESLVPTEIYKSIEDIKEIFKYNLLQYGERDIRNVIFDYCLIALKFNQPLIIVGESSYKLANIIQKTFAAENSKIIIPNDTDFNLNVLNDIKNIQKGFIDFTVIHNVHISSASLNLSGFMSAYESKKTKNKIIFTFDSFADSKFILEQLKTYLILDISHRAFLPSPFEYNKELKLGQIEYDIWSDYIQPELDFQESSEELLETIIENDPTQKESEIKKHLKTTFKRLIYANQFLNNSRKTLSYSPFLEDSLSELRGDE